MTVTRHRSAAQQPNWADASELRAVVTELRGLPPLVAAQDCAELERALADAAAGRSVVLQAGDCAERFSDANLFAVAAKVAAHNRLAELVRTHTGLTPVRVGRLAGQYAKPRSATDEVLPDGVRIPVYRGDAVNAEAPTPQGRRADPRRLLRAYDSARAVLDGLALLPGPRAGVPVFVSHEALLLDYERALVRRTPDGRPYLASAHGFWIGERTRQLDGEHIAFAAAMANPVAVKLGPGVTGAEVLALTRILNPDDRPGRVSLIVRMGADRVADALPPVVEAVARHGTPVTWLCDPMHGNTVRTSTGQKTRVTADINREVATFANTVLAAGEWPAGLHLETTPDQVAECVETAEQLADPGLCLESRSACDPRLTTDQAADVVRRFALMIAGAAGRWERGSA